MPKVLLDLDPDLLAEAAIALKTTTHSETVAAALRWVVADAERRAQAETRRDG